MLVKDQIEALKRHNVRITVSMCDGVKVYRTPNGKLFVVTWIVEEGIKYSYFPGSIEVDFGEDVCYSRDLNEGWDGVPKTLLKAFEKSDLCGVLFADTFESGVSLVVALYGLDCDETEFYDRDECLYNLDVCKEADLLPISKCITVY